MKFYEYTAIIILALSVCSSAIGDTLRFDSLKRGQRTVSMHAGYGENHRIPGTMKVHFTSDLFKLRYGRFTSPRTEVSYEFIGEQQNEDLDSYSIAGLVSYRKYISIRGRTALSYDLGIGVIHLGDRVEGLATKNNFIEQAGFTLQHTVSESSAISLEYRFSHISNADIEQPNIGINSSNIMIGYSWYK